MVDKMESSERRSAYAAAEASSEVMKEHPVTVLGLPRDVAPGTHSTDRLLVPTAAPSPHRDYDGSVISAMTEPNVDAPSILLVGEEETASQQSLERYEDRGAPEQVILPEDAEPFPPRDDGTLPPPPSQSSPPSNEKKMEILVSTPVQKEEAAEVATVATAATVHAPEQKNGRVDVDDAVCRSVITEVETTNASQISRKNMLASRDEGDDCDGLDDYIRSPEVQNAIVERSPGGRYVRFSEKLGSGASKDVYRAYDTQEGIEVAWNVVNLSGVPKTERNRIVNEVRLLERLHHQNIISFHGSWVNRERQEVNFVTEILSSGTLKSFINKVQVIRWKIAKRWALQILKGLEYLHSQDPPVIHRDLKCENIFINGTSGDLRIGDLGLSTVHRNGRVLSVLGTPEFMAPDMYEENSYNEKVDVYAFGMCLLEIFTKEIPYSECSNPAQIYKKVSAGEPPEVLSRLQSKHAREFVMLCLGYRDESGNFIRPTVSELIMHPFLDKRANDDDEVVVDRPLRERTITETAGESMNGTPIAKRKLGTHTMSGQSHHHSQPSQMDGVSSGGATPPSVRKLLPSAATSSHDEEDGDRFEEMQQSEINMRKVKVLIGRGQELKDDDENRHSDLVSSDHHHGRSQEHSSRVVHSLQPPPPPPPPMQNPQQSPGRPSQDEPATTFHYLVAAAVMENENLNTRPYADDILKLVVTLPVEGQTQHVQFDFHLVEDDPVQVAKEMVKELDIPQGAVLEISETISGLARTARMKQDKYASRIQTTHNPPPQTFHQVAPSGQQNHNSGSMSNIQHEAVHYHTEGGLPYGVHPSHLHLHQSGATVSVGLVQPDVAQYQHSLPTTALQQGNMASLSEHVLFPHSQNQTPNQQMQNSSTNAIVKQDGVHYHQGSNTTSFQIHPMIPHSNGVHHEQQMYPVGTSAPAVMQKQNGQAPTGHVYEGQQYHTHQASNVSREFPHYIHHDPPRQMESHQYLHPTPQPVAPWSEQHDRQIQPDSGRHQTQQLQLQEPHAMYSATRAGSYAVDQSNPQHQLHAHATPQSTPPVLAAYPSSPGHATKMSVSSQIMKTAPAGHVPVSSMHPGSVLLQQSVAVKGAPRQQIGSSATIDPHLAQDQSFAQEISSTQSSIVSNRPSAGLANTVGIVASQENTICTSLADDVDVDVDSDNDEISDELRKLDEDYQKNLDRAKKVFVNRMDNLQRSQIEREAQHLKTLEKHEKERAEFEKRVSQEAEQQSRRIEQLQRDWDKRRENVAMVKRRGKDGSLLSTSDVNAEMTAQPGSGSASHLRTTSSSSNFSVSPSLSLHKQEPFDGER